MGAADFLLAPEVQKLLQLVFSRPNTQLTTGEIAKVCKLDVDDVERTQQHLVQCGILTRCKLATDETEAVRANTAFVFYAELRSIALKSFAAAEPIRAMLRSKFRKSVLRAYLLGEDVQGTVEVLVVHGREVPDEKIMSVACRKLSASIDRHLEVHVISGQKFASLSARDNLGRKLASASALELIAEGDSKAKQAVGREGLLDLARKTLGALVR
jgi:hypothetical protein